MPFILRDFVSDNMQPISTVEMHTSGEPTRIVYSGLPQLQGATLLQKRNDAQTNHDDMFGALLVNETELTTNGMANIGVLFMHNEGWATIRSDLFPLRRLELDKEEMTTAIKLHCPCGVVDVTVPVTIGSGGQLRSDPERQVSFVNVHCFASGIDVENALPPLFRWPELGERSFVTIDICYWGAFYCVIGEKELGFPNGLNASSVVELSRATERLKAALVADTKFKKLFQHADEKDLSFLYGMIVTDEKQGRAVDGTAGQVDRSPCGSGVAARRALAHAKGLLPPEKRWTYQSLVSNAYDGQNAFTAHVVESPGHFRQRDPRKDSVRIRILLWGSQLNSLLTWLHHA
ncbi:Diaminopimelate epimerase-like protein [Cadophora sp. DSE1049]|nr:Diaminopimelate epimerase-like protein [Cadophora sp. DSE1049]